MIPGSPAYRGAVIDERALVNWPGCSLLASGGSTNPQHPHGGAGPRRRAGADLGRPERSLDVVPLLVPHKTRNGPADVNAFEQAGACPA